MLSSDSIVHLNLEKKSTHSTMIGKFVYPTGASCFTIHILRMSQFVLQEYESPFSVKVTAFVKGQVNFSI